MHVTGDPKINELRGQRCGVGVNRDHHLGHLHAGRSRPAAGSCPPPAGSQCDRAAHALQMFSATRLLLLDRNRHMEASYPRDTPSQQELHGAKKNGHTGCGMSVLFGNEARLRMQDHRVACPVSQLHER